MIDLSHANAGPGAFDFQQGDNNGTLFWRVVRSFIKLPSAEATACHAPKPILLDTGNIQFPYPWYVTCIAHFPSELHPAMHAPARA